MMKDLIIGSNSFSGQDFVDILLEDPEREVIGISRSREKENFLLKYKSHRNASAFQFRQFDLNLNMTEFLEFLEFERPRRIINFAAQSEVGPSWDHPEHWFQGEYDLVYRHCGKIRIMDLKASRGGGDRYDRYGL